MKKYKNSGRNEIESDEIQIKLYGEIAKIYNFGSKTDDQDDNVTVLQYLSKYLDILKINRLRKTQSLCLLIQFTQQITGIQALVFYSASIINSFGYSYEISSVLVVLTACPKVLCVTFAANVVDKYGRKILLIVAFTILALVNFGLTFTVMYGAGGEKYDDDQSNETTAEILSYVSLALISIFFSTFAIGPGSIPSFIQAEMMTSDYVDEVQLICLIFNFGMSFLIGLLFPSLNNAIHSFVFLLFGSLTLVSVVAVYLFFPETKGKNSLEVQAEIMGWTIEEAAQKINKKK